MRNDMFPVHHKKALEKYIPIKKSEDHLAHFHGHENTFEHEFPFAHSLIRLSAYSLTCFFMLDPARARLRLRMQNPRIMFHHC
jgi:hypothetical protein